ncbi:hypothetical protein BC781_104220 [Sediminitomix flava]|uniref:Uncharacterized protein n=1 Tax=Sediminitomix flava TaxID=379075 RepID=A0A315Z9S2_SEDFL|nr:hypothetical protein BC781_104220 [Sediminitomix flava]
MIKRITKLSYTFFCLNISLGESVKINIIYVFYQYSEVETAFSRIEITDNVHEGTHKTKIWDC